MELISPLIFWGTNTEQIYANQCKKMKNGRK